MNNIIEVDWAEELRRNVLKGKIEEKKISIANGAKITQLYKGGWSLAHFCARKNQLEALKHIVLYGGDLSVKKKTVAQPYTLPAATVLSIL